MIAKEKADSVEHDFKKKAYVYEVAVRWMIKYLADKVYQKLEQRVYEKEPRRIKEYYIEAEEALLTKKDRLRERRREPLNKLSNIREDPNNNKINEEIKRLDNEFEKLKKENVRITEELRENERREINELNRRRKIRSNVTLINAALFAIQT